MSTFDITFEPKKHFWRLVCPKASCFKGLVRRLLCYHRYYRQKKRDFPALVRCATVSVPSQNFGQSISLGGLLRMGGHNPFHRSKDSEKFNFQQEHLGKNYHAVIRKGAGWKIDAPQKSRKNCAAVNKDWAILCVAGVGDELHQRIQRKGPSVRRKKSCV